jgi:dipeptidyl aminopeptidase/acylaminoacyl peptidase
VRPDGSDLHMLPDCGDNAYSPDGPADSSWVAYHRLYGNGWIARTDGSGCTDLGFRLGGTRVSRDGRYIVGSDWSVPTYNSDVYVYDVLTGVLTNVTQALRQGDNAFVLVDIAPDNSKLAVAHLDRTLGQYDIWVMNLDGSDPVDITADWPDSSEEAPSWSPDGRFILFVSNRAGNRDIWAMRPDGTGRVNLTQTPEDEYGPADMQLVAPTITTAPTSETVYAGRAARFSVSATGSGPFTYEWLFNGTPITGATNSTLGIELVTSDHSGSYTVVVRNAVGAITNDFVLTVLDQPFVPCVRVSGPIGQTYRIEYTTDIAKPGIWLALATITLTSNSYLFTDISGVAQPHRFYRVIRVP